MSILESKIAELITPSVAHMGYRLVRVRLGDIEGRNTLQIMAERVDGKGMRVEDCEAISHQAGAVLDVHDPIPAAYYLEVSSPGIDRPLITPEDFAKYEGFEAKMETAYPIEGRKRYRGILKGMDAQKILIEVDKAVHAVPLEAIASAKLMLTDELIEWYRKEFSPAEGNQVEGGMV